MLEKYIPTENTPRSPIPAMVKLLKSHDPKEVRVLIARLAGTSIYNGDSEELFYWAVIHHAVFGGNVGSEVLHELMETMTRATGGSH